MYSFKLISLFLLSVSHLAFAKVERICPIQKCGTCLDRKLQVFPGIGTHLGLTSGTLAISHTNGTISDIAHIPAPQEYISLMRHLTTSPNRTNLPPMDTFPQRMQFVKAELKRRIRRLVGFPGSGVAYTLGLMLYRLRSEAEKQLSMSVETVGLVLPDAALVSMDEINDALRFAGLKKIDRSQYWDREFNAAYTAHGYGLCASYTDPYQCEEEEDVFEEHRLLHLGFTANSLSASGSWIKSARTTYADSKFVDWELEWNIGTQWASGNEYWEAVKSRIRGLEPPKERPYTKLLLTGERVDDEGFSTFLQVAKEALWDDDLKSQVESTRTMDAEFVVARGAAELQYRRQRGWLNCVQTHYCKATTIWGKLRVKWRGLSDPWYE